MKKLLLFIVFTSTLASCGRFFKEKPEIAEILSAHFNNRLYKKFDTAAYKAVFIDKLEQQEESLPNPGLIKAFYEKQEYLPVLVARFYVDGQLDSLRRYVDESREHGFNPEIFNHTSIAQQLQVLGANSFKNIREVYETVASLELNAVGALYQYTNFMGHGAINPRKFFDLYHIPIKRPDSAKMDSVLNTVSMVAELRAAQPKTVAYATLKKALKHYRDSLRTDENPQIKAIKMNLERLRWRWPKQTMERVEVNIPDYTLTWFNNQDTLAHMKVCVGSKREAGYAEKKKAYLKSRKIDDKPKNHETPQLFSVFNSVQVNPIWNIPVSIAKNEIYWMARKDPFYLSNNNIKVYYKGQLVEYPDTIDWSRYPREKLPFQFKQDSGEGNALGKFKFVFENSFSIYLHDTNNKSAFRRSNRAISHGCIRVEEPLRFAQLMVNSEQQYDRLRMEVDLPPLDTAKNELFKKKLAKKTDTLNLFKLKPSWFASRKNIAIAIVYYTAWAENGKVEFRPDVYEYDPILWRAIEKYM